MAIGDGENDVEMLELASFGVALANGSEKAKAVADATGISNDDDGVADAIYRYAFWIHVKCIHSLELHLPLSLFFIVKRKQWTVCALVKKKKVNCSHSLHDWVVTMTLIDWASCIYSFLIDWEQCHDQNECKEGGKKWRL